MGASPAEHGTNPGKEVTRSDSNAAVSAHRQATVRSKHARYIAGRTRAEKNAGRRQQPLAARRVLEKACVKLDMLALSPHSHSFYDNVTSIQKAYIYTRDSEGYVCALNPPQACHIQRAMAGSLGDSSELRILNLCLGIGAV